MNIATHLPAAARRKELASLQNAIRSMEGAGSRAGEKMVSTGCSTLDELLPYGGIREGSVIEWFNSGHVGNAAALSLRMGREVVSADHSAVLIDPGHVLHSLALASCGFDLARVVLVRPASESDALWACEEAMRCRGVRFVWANLTRVSNVQFRRLQLAVEKSHSIGFLLRPLQARHHPSWADARLVVHPLPSPASLPHPRFRVEVVYSRGEPRRSAADIMLDSLTGTIHEVPTPTKIPLSLVS